MERVEVGGVNWEVEGDRRSREDRGRVPPFSTQINCVLPHLCPLLRLTSRPFSSSPSGGEP